MAEIQRFVAERRNSCVYANGVGFHIIQIDNPLLSFSFHIGTFSAPEYSHCHLLPHSTLRAFDQYFRELPHYCEYLDALSLTLILRLVTRALTASFLPPSIPLFPLMPYLNLIPETNKCCAGRRRPV